MVKSVINNKPTNFSAVLLSPDEYEDHDHTYSDNETQVLSGQGEDVPSTSSTSMTIGDAIVGSGIFVGTDDDGNSYFFDPTNTESPNNKTMVLHISPPQQGQFHAQIGTYYTPDVGSSFYKDKDQLRQEAMELWNDEPRFLPYDHENRVTEEIMTHWSEHGIDVEPVQDEADDDNWVIGPVGESSQFPTTSSFIKGDLANMVGNSFQMLEKEIEKLQISKDVLKAPKVQAALADLEGMMKDNDKASEELIKLAKEKNDKIKQLCKKVKLGNWGEVEDVD